MFRATLGVPLQVLFTGQGLRLAHFVLAMPGLAADVHLAEVKWLPLLSPARGWAPQLRRASSW